MLVCTGYGADPDGEQGIQFQRADWQDSGNLARGVYHPCRVPRGHHCCLRRDPNLANLLLATKFREKINSYQDDWRRAVTEAINAGIPRSAFSASLAYYDSYRSERLPANLIQAQRDFSAHTPTNALIDPEYFHSNWES